MRRRRFAGVLACAAAFLLTGCFQSSILVKLNPDGSGTIEQTLSMATQTIEQLKALAAMDADKKGADADTNELFSVERAKAAAAKMGTGVSFVSASKANTQGRTGLKAVYAFKDIRTLALNAMPPSFAADLSNKVSDPMSLSFTQLPNGHALLTIKNDETAADMMPMKPAAGAPARPARGGGADDEAQAMVKAMLGGLKVDLAIQVGHVIKTNIPYVIGSTVTVISVDFDQVLANTAAFDKLDKAQTPVEMKAALRSVKGIKINVEPELKIEFTK